jgi:hypothetical protein
MVNLGGMSKPVQVMVRSGGHGKLEPKTSVGVEV